MKRNKGKVLVLSLLLVFGVAFAGSAHSLAASTSPPRLCKSVDPTQVFYVNDITAYNPWIGGINGTPGKSASQMPAGDYSMEAFLTNKAPAIMIAVTRKSLEHDYAGPAQYNQSGTSFLYGGVYVTEFADPVKYSDGKSGLPGVTLSSSKQLVLIAADRLAKNHNSENHVDIVTHGYDSENYPKYYPNRFTYTWINEQNGHNLKLTACTRADVGKPPRTITRSMAYKNAIANFCDGAKSQGTFGKDLNKSMNIVGCTDWPEGN